MTFLKNTNFRKRKMTEKIDLQLLSFKKPIKNLRNCKSLQFFPKSLH